MLVPVLRTRTVGGWPFNEFFELSPGAERLFEQVTGAAGRTNDGLAGWVPPMDVIETDQEVRCLIEVPGVAREDLEITTQGNTLRVAGTRKLEREDREARAARRVFERRYGRFERVIALSDRIDTRRIHARYEDGVLTVVLPRSEEAKPRIIPIENGAEPHRVEAGTAA